MTCTVWGLSEHSITWRGTPQLSLPIPRPAPETTNPLSVSVVWTLAHTEPWIRVLSLQAPSTELRGSRFIRCGAYPRYDWITVHCIGGHLRCVHIPATMSSATVNVRVQVFVWVCVHFSWVWAGRGLAGSYGDSRCLPFPGPAAAPHILPDARHRLSCSMGASGGCDSPLLCTLVWGGSSRVFRRRPSCGCWGRGGRSPATDLQGVGHICEQRCP